MSPTSAHGFDRKHHGGRCVVRRAGSVAFPHGHDEFFRRQIGSPLEHHGHDLPADVMMIFPCGADDNGVFRRDGRNGWERARRKPNTSPPFFHVSDLFFGYSNVSSAQFTGYS